MHKKYRIQNFLFLDNKMSNLFGQISSAVNYYRDYY